MITSLKKTIKITFILFFIPLFSYSCNDKDDDVLNEIEVDRPISKDVVSVTDYGIANDGSPIGKELNKLVEESYRKTLFFPAGTYNLTEPIITPLDYTKQVNITFDKHAVIKSDNHLEALLKVGYSERYIIDSTLKLSSYIEGGVFDCYNVDNGIIVNGLKQLVQLRSITLQRGRNTHIRINVSDDFVGTASSDTKIDNVTIQGIGSNDDVIGIYIDHSCHDNKISDTFIYGTKQAIITKSSGHILNNIHILSMTASGGTYLGEGENYLDSEGIRMDADGFFIFNQVYFDSVDKGIVVNESKSPKLLLDQNISYSYIDSFGTSFIYQKGDSGMEIKLSNSVITVPNKNYTIFDLPAPEIGWDIKERFTFINNTIENPELLNPYNLIFLQKLRKVTSEALVYTNLSYFDTDWHVLGALVTSPHRSLLNIDLRTNLTIELDLKFEGGNELKINQKDIFNPDNEKFDIAYVAKGNFCVLLFRPKNGGDYYPIISDKLGSGSYMIPPSKDRHYRLKDYSITDSPVIF